MLVGCRVAICNIYFLGRQVYFDRPCCCCLLVYFTGDLAWDTAQDTKAHIQAFKLFMQPKQVSWSSALMQAPWTVTLMSQLAVVASKRDFSMEAQRPTGGFKYMQHPKSFRATVLQVADEGWKAFTTARYINH